MAEDMGEKTEEATAKKRQDSRSRGQVAKSTDLGALILLGAAMAAIATFAGMMLERGGELIRLTLDGDFLAPQADPGEVGVVLAASGREILAAMAPVLGLVFVAGVVSHLVQVGPLLAWKAIEPSFSKLSPLTGFKRLFGLQSLVKAALDILKVVAIVSVAAVTLWQYEKKIAMLAEFPLMVGIIELGWMIVDFTLRLLVVLLLIGILDFIWQRIKYSKDLRMSKHEVKQEMKNADGDPEVKKRRMRMAQQIAMQRIGASVPTADVIVTNPEHYSIAIRYDEDTMLAPVVVAKGVDALAMRIRQIAAQHRIPIVERPPLARGLYRDVEVGHPIPADFYTAVAEVLAYVYQLEGQAVAA